MHTASVLFGFGICESRCLLFFPFLLVHNQLPHLKEDIRSAGGGQNVHTHVQNTARENRKWKPGQKAKDNILSNL